MTTATRRVPISTALVLALLAAGTTAHGCGGKADTPAKAPEVAKTEAAKTEAATAVAPKVAEAVTPQPRPEAVWPNPMPAGWKLFNDYEATFDPRKTSWGGFWDAWAYRGGKCLLSVADEGGSRRLKVEFALPMDNSQCGTFEYLGGEKGKPKPVDISAYDSIVFLLKSGDADEHKVRFEVTELDPYDAALQGYTGETAPLAAGREWARYQVHFDKVLHPMFDRRKGKQVGIRIDRKDQGAVGSGVVLLDNITFIPKAQP